MVALVDFPWKTRLSAAASAASHQCGDGWHGVCV